MIIWKKEVLSLSVGTTQAISSGEMMGRVEQILIQPLDSSGVLVSTSSWDVSITDRNGELIGFIDTQTGRYDWRAGLPVGSDRPDIVTFTFSSVTQTPATIRIMMKVLEK